MSEKKLTWTITSLERRSQIKKFILISWVPLTLITIYSCFEYVSNFVSWALRDGINRAVVNVVVIILGVSSMTFLFFLVNLFFPYKKRSYVLSKEGINIAKGKKKKFFSWDCFESFYPYRMIRVESEDNNSFRGDLSKAESSAEGQIFYLKKKSVSSFSKLYKVFVIVRAEKENSEEVLNFLSSKLERKQMKPTSDLGLVFYKFK